MTEKHKLDPTGDVNGDAAPEAKRIALDLADKFNPTKFQLVKVLKNDAKIKSLVLHCQVDKNDAIVVLQKNPFPEDPEKIKESGLTDKCEMGNFSAKTFQSNDVYNKLLVQAGFEAINEINMTVIYPAEENHFKRFQSFGRKMLQETPQMYAEITVPYLAQSPRDLAWVENILDGKSEHDRVIFSNPDPNFGYTLVLDYRWNGKLLTELHCLGLTRNAKLTCLRDLTMEHVPMLQEMYNKAKSMLSEKFKEGTEYDKSRGLVPEDVMGYFHYPPTFYWLHMHLVHVDTADDQTTRAGRAHLVDEVIRNLQIDSNFYRDRTMTIFLGSQSPMLKALTTKEDQPV